MNRKGPCDEPQNVRENFTRAHPVGRDRNQPCARCADRQPGPETNHPPQARNRRRQIRPGSPEGAKDHAQHQRARTAAAGFIQPALGRLRSEPRAGVLRQAGPDGGIGEQLTGNRPLRRSACRGLSVRGGASPTDTGRGRGLPREGWARGGLVRSSEHLLRRRPRPVRYGAGATRPKYRRPGDSKVLFLHRYRSYRGERVSVRRLARAGGLVA